MAPTPVFVALLAGGRGTRFWPLSRHRLPKQLLDVTGEGPMLRLTRDRVAALCPPRNVLVVTTEDLAGASARLLRLPARNVIGEPAGRNTGPAVGLAALIAATRDPDAVVLALPADHHVSREAQLRTLLRRGIRAARAHRGIVIFGIVPDRPETGYGYVRGGNELDGFAGCFAVERFVEKPDRATAERYLASGRFLWNSGMFFFRARVMIDAIAAHMPELGRILDAISRDPSRAAELYPQAPAISIDYGVIEKLPVAQLGVVPGDFGWNDVGSWAALPQLAGADSAGNVAVGATVTVDSANNLIYAAEGQLVATAGVRDMVIVAAGGAVLVLPRERAQDVREVVKALDAHWL